MSYTYEQARDHLYNTFWQRWIDPVAGIVTVFSTFDPAAHDAPTAPVVVLWEEEEPEDLENVTKPTLYNSVRHYSTPRKHVGGESRHIFGRKGFFLSRIYIPTDTGLKTGDQVAYVVKSAFEGKRGFGDGNRIVFRGVRVTENGARSGRFLFTVTADFEYDEVIKGA